MIAESEIDLVLLDIVMPEMDGYEVCRRIREQVDTAYLPVVMVTASGDEQKVKALEAGADDFLTKPINQSELLARVASLARIKRYQDTIKRQADELTDWNRELESRVETQVDAAGADGPPAPLPVAPAGGADRRLGRRVVPARATAARSWSCSATCAASRRSPSRASPRR